MEAREARAHPWVTSRLEAGNEGFTDHRIPLGRGGSNLIANILPACRRCNRRKHLMGEENSASYSSANGVRD
jgi:hypothetical protein